MHKLKVNQTFCGNVQVIYFFNLRFKVEKTSLVYRQVRTNYFVAYGVVIIKPPY